jgi:hypothetical protein
MNTARRRHELGYDLPDRGGVGEHRDHNGGAGGSLRRRRCGARTSRHERMNLFHRTVPDGHPVARVKQPAREGSAHPPNPENSDRCHD